MRLYVVRHAHAGSRSAWEGPDEDRPLSPKGHRQSVAIAEALAAVGSTRLVSSIDSRTRENAPSAATTRSASQSLPSSSSS